MVIQVNSESSPTRSVLLLALPVLMEQFLGMLVGLVDTWLTGNYVPGDAYLAAIGLMAYVLWFIPNVFSVVSIGATAMVARFIGADDKPAANRIVNHAILLGLMLAAVATFVFWWWGEPFIRLMQLQGDAGEFALRYLNILVPSIPAMMIIRVFIACLRGAGDTVTGLIVMTLVNALNVLLSIGLVVGTGFLPRLGWDGIAYGTAISQIIGALILLVIVSSDRGAVTVNWRSVLRPDVVLCRRILHIGVPGGLDSIIVIACHFWFVTIVNSLGNEQAAAHSLAIRIESLAYLPGTAFQVSATTLTGQYLGAKNQRSAQRSVIVSVVAGCGVMLLAGWVFFVFGANLARFFAAEASDNTIESTASLLRIAAFVMPSMAISMIIGGGLLGAGDTRWPMLINLVGIIGIRIPLAYFLTGTIRFSESQGPMFGLMGAWYAMLIDILLRSILFVSRFLNGSWKKIRV